MFLTAIQETSHGVPLREQLRKHAAERAGRADFGPASFWPEKKLANTTERLASFGAIGGGKVTSLRRWAAARLRGKLAEPDEKLTAAELIVYLADCDEDQRDEEAWAGLDAQPDPAEAARQLSSPWRPCPGDGERLWLAGESAAVALAERGADEAVTVLGETIPAEELAAEDLDHRLAVVPGNRSSVSTVARGGHRGLRRVRRSGKAQREPVPATEGLARALAAAELADRADTGHPRWRGNTPRTPRRRGRTRPAGSAAGVRAVARGRPAAARCRSARPGRGARPPRFPRLATAPPHNVNASSLPLQVRDRGDRGSWTERSAAGSRSTIRFPARQERVRTAVAG